MRSIPLADFQPDLAAVDGPFECTGRNPIGLSSVGREIVGPDAVSFSAAFPRRAETKATVVVIVDSAGKIIRYAQRRSPAIHPASGPVAVVGSMEKLGRPLDRAARVLTQCKAGQ
jgi:hypothetical protein